MKLQGVYGLIFLAEQSPVKTKKEAKMTDIKFDHINR